MSSIPPNVAISSSLNIILSRATVSELFSSAADVVCRAAALAAEGEVCHVSARGIDSFYAPWASFGPNSRQRPSGVVAVTRPYRGPWPPTRDYQAVIDRANRLSSF